jgi:C4-dicarboxylate transporter, DctQ subunit
MTRFFHYTQRLEAWLLAWAVIAMAALTIANVACRTFLGFSLAFAEELSQFLIIFVCFIGLSYAAGRGRHIRMTALYDQLGRRGRKALMIFIAGTTCLLMLLLAWYSVRYIAVVHGLGTVSPVLRVPLAVVYLSVPLGFVLSALQYAMTVVRNVRETDVYLSYDQKDEYEPPAAGRM